MNMAYLSNASANWTVPSRAPAPATKLAWLQRVYGHVARGTVDQGGEIIYDEMDLLLGDAKWPDADAVLDAVQIDKLDPLTMVAFLTITGAARDKLAKRPAYFKKVRERLAREMTPERLERVLVGLE